MNCRIKKLACFFVFFLIGFSSLFCEEYSSAGANRKTSMRFLQLAKNYASKGEWEKTGEAARTGNAYDSSVADLWYLMALSDVKRGAKRRDVIPLIKNSLDGKEWVDYNMSNARIFYADLLCSVGKPEEALRTLDAKPFIYSSDAEYIRIKSYYEKGDEASLKLAREKVDVTRRIYPLDSRFPHVFFEYEYKNRFKPDAEKSEKIEETEKSEEAELDPVVRKIADAFIRHMPEYDKNDLELELYAAVFAEGEQRSRLLKAFSARGFKHERYAAAALQEEIFTEAQALNYFLDFVDKGIFLCDIEYFASVLKEEETKKQLFEYLNAYNGVLYSDTNNTLEPNLIVTYSRGRPQKIEYDENNSGYNDWVCSCDFGVPLSVHMEEKKYEIVYGTYPYIGKIILDDVPGEPLGKITYTMIDESVKANVLEIASDEFIKPGEFYVVRADNLWNEIQVDAGMISKYVSSMEKPSFEREGAVIKFSMLDGKPYAADYIADGKVYAHAQFTEEEIGCIRTVDKNGDGVFETIETYGINDGTIEISDQDMDALTQNIWGSPVSGSLLYLKMVQIDRNLDTLSDYSEEYFTSGGRTVTWDNDYDSGWDMKYIRQSQKPGESLTEISSMHLNDAVLGNIVVSIISRDGNPVLVRYGEREASVVPGKRPGFFWFDAGWLNDDVKEGYEGNVFGQANEIKQGIFFLVEQELCFINAVKIGENIFARPVQKSENKAEDKAEDKTIEDKLPEEN